MRVMCIDGGAKGGWTELVEGKEYEVDFTEKQCGCDEEVYLVHGLSRNTQCQCGRINDGPVYKACRFVPTSDIDEREMVRDYDEMLVKIEK